MGGAMANKTFFVEDHTVTNIGLVQLITQKTGMDCAGGLSQNRKQLKN